MIGFRGKGFVRRVREVKGIGGAAREGGRRGIVVIGIRARL